MRPYVADQILRDAQAATRRSVEEAGRSTCGEEGWPVLEELMEVGSRIGHGPHRDSDCVTLPSPAQAARGQHPCAGSGVSLAPEYVSE